MYVFGVHKRIKQIIALFHLLDIWQNSKTSTRKVAKCFYFVLYSTFFITLIWGAALSDDRTESIFLMAVALTSANFLLKLKYILWYQEDIENFMQNIGTHTVADRKEFHEIEKANNNLMMFVTVFFLMTFLGMTPICIFCVFSDERKLPLNVGLPWNWRTSGCAYWTAYFYTLYGFLYSWVCMLVTVFIWYLMMNCSIQYGSLGKRFRSIGISTTSANKINMSKAQESKIFLRNLIESHQNLQKIIERFGGCFNYLFFIHISTSGVIICGSLYILAFNNESLLISISFGDLVIYNIFDIFMVMYFGNEIKLSSDRLSYCLFESNWINQSNSFKKCMVILMEILRHPQQLVVCKLFPLTLDTFTSILNNTYRMFNVLINLK